jgi:hypothetical protein
LIAARDILARTGNGDVLIAKDARGENLVFVLETPGNQLEVGNASVGKTISAEADRVNIDQLTHTGTQDYLQIKLSGAGGQAMDDVTIGNIDSSQGVQVEGLWANTADIHTSGEYFSLQDVYLIDHGYLSNGATSMTLFGKNPVLDDSDIQMYFVPGHGDAFTRISFQNEFSHGQESYKLLSDFYSKAPSNQGSLVEEVAASAQRNHERLWNYVFGEQTTVFSPGEFQRIIYRDATGELLLPRGAGQDAGLFLGEFGGRFGIFNTSAYIKSIEAEREEKAENAQ